MNVVQFRKKDQIDVTAIPDFPKTGETREPTYVNRRQSAFANVGDIETPEASKPMGPEHISIDQLYHTREALSLELRTALHLLSENILRLQEAEMQLSQGNAIAADNAVQRLQADIPELFCCRTLGDGFGLVVNALNMALHNRNGVPLELTQLRLVTQIIRRLKSEPFLSTDRAVEQVGKLEAAEFEVAPPGFEYLADLLSNE